MSGYTTLFERRIVLPEGLRLDGSKGGSEWEVWVDQMEDGTVEVDVCQTSVTPTLALEMARALIEAAEKALVAEREAKV